MDFIREELKHSEKERRQQAEWEDRESRRAPDHDEDRDPLAKREHHNCSLRGISKITEHDEIDISFV